MKKYLKLFAIILAFIVVLTLAQASTFVGVYETEREFFVRFFESPSSQLGSITFWKYVVLISDFIFIIAAAVYYIIFKSKSGRIIKNSGRSKKEEHSDYKNEPPEGADPDTSKEVITEVPDKPTSGRFKRVNNKK